MTEQTPQADSPSGGSGMIVRIAVLAALIIVPLAAALGLYKMVVAPRLAADAEEMPAADSSDKIPITAVPVEFEKTQASLIMPETDMPKSLLIYEVTLDCANPETQALVNAHKARFADMLATLHGGRRREDVDDPLLKESIQKQAKQKANDILRRLQPEVNPDIRVIDVFHTEFFVHE